jgi:RimJ/RimL family protein N-acetyltransferase
MILTQGNITLRPWHKTDARPLAVMANCKEIADSLRDGFPYPYSVQDARNWLKLAIEYNNDSTKYFAIEFDKTLVGSIGFVQKENIYRKNVELGYFIDKNHWGRGIASASIQLIVPYIFGHFDVIRIYAEPYAHNTASRRVLEKNGFECEATLKSYVIKNGVVLDSCIYSLLRESCLTA